MVMTLSGLYQLLGDICFRYIQLFATYSVIREPIIWDNFINTFLFFSFDVPSLWRVLFNMINLFLVTGLFQYPLKKSEKLWFSDVSRCGKRPVEKNGLTHLFPMHPFSIPENVRKP